MSRVQLQIFYLGDLFRIRDSLDHSNFLFILFHIYLTTSSADLLVGVWVLTHPFF